MYYIKNRNQVHPDNKYKYFQLLQYVDIYVVYTLLLLQLYHLLYELVLLLIMVLVLICNFMEHLRLFRLVWGHVVYGSFLLFIGLVGVGLLSAVASMMRLTLLRFSLCSSNVKCFSPLFISYLSCSISFLGQVVFYILIKIS